MTWHTRLFRGSHAKKRFENALAVLHRATWAFVAVRELHFPVSGGPSPDADWGAGWRVFDRVLEQVGEHALNLDRIHRHGRKLGGILRRTARPPSNPRIR